jgi:hypothetical protein
MFFVTLYVIKITSKKSNKMVIFTNKREFCSCYNEPLFIIAIQGRKWDTTHSVYLKSSVAISCSTITMVR